MTFTRRWLVAALLAGAATPALPDAPARSPRPPRRAELATEPAAPVAPVAQTDTAAMVASARLGGTVAFVAADARTGRVFDSFNGAARMPPASTAKAITALYALEKLGPSYRFVTRILATGPVAGGIVQGDLVLAGSGDPTLSTDPLGELVAALKAAGVRGVSGRYIAYAGALPHVPQIDTEQPAQVGYNPALSGLNLNTNCVHFEWRRDGAGYQVTMDARAERFVAPVTMARMEVVAREVPIYTYAGDRGLDDWTVARAALGPGGSRWLPVRHPEVYAAEVFQTLARAQGIVLPPATILRACPEGQVLAEWQSAEMTTILREMLRHSINLTAETVGLAASGASTLAQSGRAMTLWARERFRISAEFHDHSGLGAASRVSPSDMVTALATAEARGLGLHAILKTKTFGDARKSASGARPVEVAAKTGTLNFVSGLVGYGGGPSGFGPAGEGRTGAGQTGPAPSGPAQSGAGHSGPGFIFAIYCANEPRRLALPIEDREKPPGGTEWLGRARGLQGRLIERWGNRGA